MHIGNAFSFKAPDHWRCVQEGARCIFCGPDREELILSASLVAGDGQQGELEVLRRRLFQNAAQSLQKAAAHPELKVTELFRQIASVKGVDCWILCANTHAGDVLFYQAICESSRGILIATLEAPNTVLSQGIFRSLVESVAVVSES